MFVCGAVAFDVRDLWPGERRRSGSASGAARRRRLEEDGEKSGFGGRLSSGCW